MVNYLVEQGADPNLFASGFSVLYLAIEADNVDLVRYIMGKHPDMARNQCGSLLPVQFARDTGRITIAQIIDDK